MRKWPLLCCLIMVLMGSFLNAQEGMNNEKMAQVFKNYAETIEGEPGAWQLIYQERILLVITDEPNNRMRIFTPIVEETDIPQDEMRKMLIANFHTALDAKYSIYNGFVISTFTHPLQELTEEQLVDAMKQVVSLADTFGTTYSSTEFIFGGQEAPPEEKRLNKSPSKEKRS